MLPHKPKRKRSPRRYRWLLALLIFLVAAGGAALYFSQPVPTNRQFTKPKTPLTVANAQQLQLIGRINGGNVAFSDDSRFVMVDDRDGVTIWDTATGTLKQHFQIDLPCSQLRSAHACESAYYLRYEISPDGKWVLTSAVFGEGSDIQYSTDYRLWNVETGQMVKAFGPQFATYTLSPFSGDSRTLMYIDWPDCSGICAYDILTGAILTLIPNHNQTAWYDERRVISEDVLNNTLYYNLGEKLAAVNLKTGETTLMVSGTTQTVELKMSPDGRWAALVDPLYVSMIEFWNLETGQKTVLSTDESNQNLVRSRVEFTPDSTRAVIFENRSLDGSNDLIRVWDLQTGKTLFFIHVQVGAYATLTPHDSMIAILAGHGISFWSLQGQNGELLHSIYFSRQNMQGIFFSPDGTMLVTSSGEIYGIPAK
jgi:WD40 repeat protein